MGQAEPQRVGQRRGGGAHQRDPAHAQCRIGAFPGVLPIAAGEHRAGAMAALVMDYTGYLADRLHQDGKLDAFNMLYQTNPDQAARMAAAYLAETNFDAMPTPARVSTNLQDVQDRSPVLSGKTIEGEHRRHDTKASDGTASAYRKHQAAAKAQGYQQGDVANEVEAKVEAAVDANMQIIGRQQDDIVRANEKGKSEVAGQLRRDAQIPGLRGPNQPPGVGSVADQQDNVYRDLFRPSDQKKPQPKPHNEKQGDDKP